MYMHSSPNLKLSLIPAFLCLTIAITLLFHPTLPARAEEYVKQIKTLPSSMAVGQKEDVRLDSISTPKAATAESSDTAVLSVVINSNGRISVTAVGEGRATITATDTRGTKYSAEITVVPEGVLTITYPKGVDDLTIESHYELSKGFPLVISGMLKVSMVVDGKLYKTTTSDYTFTSSNPEVIRVDGNNLLTELSGEAEITLKINSCYSNPDIFTGKTFTFTAKVTGRPACTGTKMATQIKTDGFIMDKTIDVGFYAVEGQVEYEIYYSTKKNSGYKRLTTVNQNHLSSFYNSVFTKAGDLLTVHADNLKADTRYYFKVRARYTESYYDNFFSEFSKPVEYWTAPSPVDSDIKFNNSTRAGSWKEYKGAAGYIYDVHASHLNGYNIFGQEVWYFESNQFYADTNKVTAPKKVVSLAPQLISKVFPVTKHGKYYYAYGQKMSKSVKDFEYEWDSDTLV